MSLTPTSYNSSTNTGSATVTPTGENHTERMAFSGAAGTYNVILAVTGNNSPGDIIEVAGSFPATANLLVKFWTTLASGTPLATFNTDGTAQTQTGVFRFVYNNSTAWEYQRAKVPA